MEAGKALDEQVAEWVMGWRRKSAHTKNGSVEYWLGPNHENQMEPPAFSTDLAQAAKVVKLLAQKKPLLALLGLDPLDVCVAALKAFEPNSPTNS